MGKYTLPEMPYAYDALEPHIDARTMEIHHTKHHQKYTDGMNGALEKIKYLIFGDILGEQLWRDFFNVKIILVE